MPEAPTIDTGNTSWLLISSAIVLLMTPGLALFYGGLNRSKGVLNMMMMSFSAMGLVSVLWLGYGFTVAFGDDRNGVWGDLGQYLGNRTFTAETDLWGETGIPLYVFLAFQMMFAIITVALISGAVSDRARFSGWLLFAAGWATLVYFPVAHMVWGGGFIGATLGALDFAGGTAVHINAGAAALALALVLGRRVGWPADRMRPHNVPMVALGAGLLWFGWFGFNAGSQLSADRIAAVAFVNTQVCAAAAVLGWLAVERLRNGRPSLVGAASGAIAGLVAITPACAFIAPWAAVLLGLVAGAACALAVELKYRLGYDDSLDVVGVHFVAGWIGCLWIGLFGTAAVSPLVSNEGLFYGGGFTQLGAQALSALIVSVVSFVIAGALALAIEKTVGFRVSARAETEGIDLAEHAETGYDLAPARFRGGGPVMVAGRRSAAGSRVHLVVSSTARAGGSAGAGVPGSVEAGSAGVVVPGSAGAGSAGALVPGSTGVDLPGTAGAGVAANGLPGSASLPAELNGDGQAPARGGVRESTS